MIPFFTLRIATKTIFVRRKHNMDMTGNKEMRTRLESQPLIEEEE